MHARIAERAREPRYIVPEAAAYTGIPVSTVRRWSLGHVRTYQGQRRRDEPLIQPDGFGHAVPLSFLNLLELRFLASYRKRVPLQAIRRALDYAGTALNVERPLLSVHFRVRGRALFLKFAQEANDADVTVLIDATRAGQFSMDTVSEQLWPSAIDEFMGTVDYDDEQEAAFRWWPLGREKPVIINTLYNGGRPSTAVSGVRTHAIAVHRHEGFPVAEIAYDVGASEDEVAAALKFEHVAA